MSYFIVMQKMYVILRWVSLVKLTLIKQNNLLETEVEIRYLELDASVQNLINLIEKSEHYICGPKNERQHRILIRDIFYIETIDRKTFIYTESNVFRCEMKFQQLLSKLEFYGFVQANKSCILNVNVIDNIKMLYNSKMEGTLSNGEKIIITRTYIPGIKAAFVKGKGD